MVEKKRARACPPAQAKAQNGGANPSRASVSSVACQIGVISANFGDERRRRDSGVTADEALRVQRR
jgi:hypothetical protein